jgi:DNA-binding winged helix-turn-helix (wHTH) protein
VRVRFGEFVLDRDAREVTREGCRLALSPKAFQLLDVLVSARPRALSRAELNDRLWPGAAMGYTSLAGVAAELRRALADDRREPRFLRTVHGHGYAFCGEAEDEPGLSGAPRAAFACSLSWEGRSIGLFPGENVIGRDEGCAVRLELPRVSRRHARILVDGRAARIEDLGSKNGTRVREHLLTGPFDLADGDVIEIGGARFAFRSGRGPGSTLTGAA